MIESSSITDTPQVIVLPWQDNNASGGGTRIGWNSYYIGTDPDQKRTYLLHAIKMAEINKGLDCASKLNYFAANRFEACDFHGKNNRILPTETTHDPKRGLLQARFSAQGEDIGVANAIATPEHNGAMQYHIFGKSTEAEKLKEHLQEFDLKFFQANCQNMRLQIPTVPTNDMFGVYNAFYLASAAYVKRVP